MPTHHRALSALATTTLLSSGLVLGTAASAQPAPPEPGTPVQVRTADGILSPVVDTVRGILGALEIVPGVGNVLTVTKPVLDPVLGLVSLDIEWLCDGVPIPGTQGAWEVPAEVAAGCSTAARITTTVLGVPIERITSAIPVPALPGTAKAPVATTAVGVPATAKVGTPLTATPPVWDHDATDVVTTYQWLRAGTPIPGATLATYTPTRDDLDKALSVRATGTRRGAPEPTTSTSNAATVAQGDAPTATVQPAIAGNPTVGQTLGVNTPTWSGTGTTTNSYQWLRDGQPVAGATAATYLLTATDAGRAVSVRVTGKRTGYADGTATSTPVTVAAGEQPLTPTVAPSISGFAEVGRTLAASPGSWSAPDAAFTYAWRRDGITIPGATSSTYVVQLADIGSRLAVDVTAVATGFSEGTASASTPGAVGRLTSSTGATLARKKVARGTKARLRVTLRAAGAPRTGQVRIFDGKRLLRTLSVDGRRTVGLPRLSVGKHRIRAAYVGSRSTAPSASKVVVLTVVRKKK